MFDSNHIIYQLEHNQTVFRGLLQSVPSALQAWKPSSDEWCILEIVCHLLDIEVEDFRQRVQYVLEDPQRTLPSIYPTTWGEERNYLGQDYDQKVAAFLAERRQSITWLHSLEKPVWDNTYQHPTLGPMSAALFLTNWLAHDQLHIRQINRVNRQFLQRQTEMDLSYAGNW